MWQSEARRGGETACLAFARPRAHGLSAACHTAGSLRQMLQHRSRDVILRLRPTRTSRGATSPNHGLETRRVRTCTESTNLLIPHWRAYSVIRPPWENGSTPPISKTRLFIDGNSNAVNRYQSRSWMATGCAGTNTQRGEIITGNRSTRARVIQKERPPDLIRMARTR